MSVLAYCLTCSKLCVVLPRDYKFAGSRERAWYPTPHDGPDGKVCPGSKRGI